MKYGFSKFECWRSCLYNFSILQIQIWISTFVAKFIVKNCEFLGQETFLKWLGRKQGLYTKERGKKPFSGRQRHDVNTSLTTTATGTSDTCETSEDNSGGLSQNIIFILL